MRRGVAEAPVDEWEVVNKSTPHFPSTGAVDAGRLQEECRDRRAVLLRHIVSQAQGHPAGRFHDHSVPRAAAISPII